MTEDEALKEIAGTALHVKTYRLIRQLDMSPAHAVAELIMLVAKLSIVQMNPEKSLDHLKSTLSDSLHDALDAYAELVKAKEQVN